jgi:hypothetical protein
MQAHYPPAFDRDMACTEAEWLRWLPGATQGARLTLRSGQAQVRLPAGGELNLDWQALPPRRIALMCLPRLGVRFCFDAAVDEASRQRFMRFFDLYTQRGGG